MAKLLLLSFVYASIALPVRASLRPNSKEGLKKAIRWIIYFNIFYLINLRFIQTRLG